MSFDGLENTQKSTLSMLVSSTEESGYAVTWINKPISDLSVEWVDYDKLVTAAKPMEESKLPTPILLFPKYLTQAYHPIELAYIWLMRLLFKSVMFQSIVGGLREIIVRSQQNMPAMHPAVPQALNRFLLLNNFTDKLPVYIQDNLPFFACNPFIILIEVDLRKSPQLVKCALFESPKEDTIQIVPNVLNDESDTAIIENRGTAMYATFWDETKPIEHYEEFTLAQLITDGAGNWALKKVQSIFSTLFDGFPPEPIFDYGQYPK